MSSDARRTRRPRTLALAAAMTVLAGCTSAPGPLFPETESPLRWPPPPEVPRIEYAGSLETAADLKPGRAALAAARETIFGQDDDHAMLTPYAVCVDDRERLFVADSNAQVVHVFDLEKRRYAQWSPPDGFAQPVGLAWDAAGARLLVADSVGGAIEVFDAEGAHLGALGRDLLERPVGLAVDPVDRRIFVADAAAHQLVVLAHTGPLLRRVGRRGTGPGEFNYPTAVVLARDGRLYVADTLNFRVQSFDRDLAPLASIGGGGDLPGSFSRPKALAVDADDHLYVVDGNFENVQIFDRDGRLLLVFGREGQGAGEFWLPTGIFVDSSARVWVADSYNRRVQVFRYLREETSE